MIAGLLSYGRMSSSVLAVSVALFANGCPNGGGGTTPSTPTPTPSATALDCPVIGPSIPRNGCPGVRFDNVMLTCAGTGKVPFSLSADPRGGATIVDATLADGSTITGRGTPINPVCFDGIPVNIGVTFGINYRAEIGEETAAPGTTPVSCIVRSRATFTQFATNDPLLNLPGVQDIVKGLVHQELDKKVIGLVRPASVTSPARCARWRQL
jgi:hypothetical protein